MAITLEFLGQCGFIISNGIHSVAIDPVITDVCENGASILNFLPDYAPQKLKVDYILCTHDHIDHMCIGSIKAVLDCYPKTKIMVPAGCREELLRNEIPTENIETLSDKEKKQLADTDIYVEGISVAHPVHMTDEKGLDHNLAYAISMAGKCMVHLGDTYFTDRLRNSLEKLGRIDVLLAPINGMDEEKAKKGIIGNMSYKEAAVLADFLKINIAIPTHFDMVKGNTEDPDKFVSELKKMNSKTRAVVLNARDKQFNYLVWLE